MTNLTNALIIEHEPLISFSIKEALNRIIKSRFGNICTCRSVTNYDLAFSEISTSKHFNFVFLNVDMFSVHSNRLKLFKEMLTMLKRNSPKAQLLTLTSIHDNYAIADIIRTLNPESVLLKRDVSFKDLTKAIESVMDHTPFYSKSILKLLRSRMCCDISLDRRDKLILYHLSKGMKMKDLPKLVHLSNSGIENRKRNLKVLFNVERKPDHFLLEQARLNGFI